MPMVNILVLNAMYMGLGRKVVSTRYRVISKLKVNEGDSKCGQCKRELCTNKDVPFMRLQTIFKTILWQMPAYA